MLSKPDKVLKEIETMADSDFLPIIGFRKGQVLAKVIHQVKPKRVLEVGSLVGYSAILMGKELEIGAHLVTIEIDADEANMARENIRKAGLSATIHVIVGDAMEVLPKLTGEFDLVFIDADKREYIDYLRLVEDKLHRGSVVIADNAGIFANQMKNYLKYVRGSGKYSSKYIGVGEDGLEVSVKL
jgi:predicted O-methyltransferase YrrM